ncbi:MAG: hypothetical protein GX444_14840 [Myxococcales bacterium]|nr:hypothetical protein [Myxococcales bacterium]
MSKYWRRIAVFGLLAILFGLAGACEAPQGDTESSDSAFSFADPADSPFVFQHPSWPLAAAYRDGRIHLSIDGRREAISLELPRSGGEAGRENESSFSPCEGREPQTCLRFATADYRLELSGDSGGVQLNFTIDQSAVTNELTLTWPWRGEGWQTALNPKISRVEFRRDGRALLALQVRAATDAAGRDIAPVWSRDETGAPVLSSAESAEALAFPVMLVCEIFYPLWVWRVTEELPDMDSLSSAYLDENDEQIYLLGDQWDGVRSDAHLVVYNSAGEKIKDYTRQYLDYYQSYYYKMLKVGDVAYVSGGTADYYNWEGEIVLASYHDLSGFQWSVQHDCPEDYCVGNDLAITSEDNIVIVGSVMNSAKKNRQ